MSISMDFHSVATVAAGRLVYSAIAGTLLAFGVWLVLRLFPKTDSRTSFAVWFSTLLATALLPGLELFSKSISYPAVAEQRTGPAPAVLTVSTFWALVIFYSWAATALAGLGRVLWATLQVRRLRASSVAVDLETLPPELTMLIAECKKARALSVRVSSGIEVPTAIGFFNPAIILPAWLLESTPAAELRYILLHEFAHLRRRDDWTNLAQKVVQALFFFLPSVWWIERRLTLDREMACDDAVLANAGCARGYAECLARLAEKSFMRRQVALVQAAVSRMRQLTLRVARILDPDRSHVSSISMWKPAVPAVAVLATLCAVVTSNAPTLVRFTDPVPVEESGLGSADKANTPAVASPISIKTATEKSSTNVVRVNEVRAWNAGLKSAPALVRLKPGKRMLHEGGSAHGVTTGLAGKINQTELMALEARHVEPQDYLQSGLQQTEPSLKSVSAKYVTVRQEYFVVVSQRMTSSGLESWQMNVWQLTVHEPAPQQKPIPRKT